MKKKLNILIVLLLILTLVGCKKEEKKKEKLPEDTIAFLEAFDKIEFSLDCKDELENAFALYEALGEYSWDYDEVLDAFDTLVKYESLIKDYEAAKHFINSVDDIPYIVTINDKTKIESAEIAYSMLSETAKKYIDVDLAVNILTNARATYNELEKNQNEIIDSQMIVEFINLVLDIPNLNIFVPDDITYVEKAEDYYETLSDNAKANKDVINHYKIVTDARAHYENMEEDPTIYDNILIERFISFVTNLPAVDDVTLDDKAAIDKAISAYNELSTDAKKEQRVIDSLNSLNKVNDKYNQLVKEKEDKEKEEALNKQIQEFIKLVNELPSVENLRKEDGPKLADTRALYDSFPANVKENAEIKTAYTKIVTLEDKFDTFTLEQIKFPDTFANLLRDGNTPPNIVLQGIEIDFYKNMKALYNVTTGADLAKCISFYLYIYPATVTNPDNYICYGDITDVIKNESNLIPAGTIISILQNASRTNPDLKSGAFRFGVRVIDKRNLYADSDIFMGGSQTGPLSYTFNSLYNTETSTDAVEISTKEQLLAIKNNLAGNYILTADIDLENMEWVNLGDFSGTLDGQGHKIYNIAHSEGGVNVFGLFQKLNNGSKVSRIVLEGIVTNAGDWAGTICIQNYGIIENCILNLDITALGEAGHIAGISTDNYGIITSCLVLSKIDGKGTLYGECTSNLVINNFGTIENCFASKDNSLTDKTIHANNGTSNSCGSYTNSELKNSSLYAKWDTTIWNIVNGSFPTLKVVED